MDKDKEKEKDKEKDKESKVLDKSKVTAIGMVVKDKGRKKKEKKGKDDTGNKKITDSEENYTIDSVFKGKSKTFYVYINV